ncbi:ribosomal-processing cysteine protease Prp [Treponema sp.]|uniref:ribosomal-processing cysteine protease Prp n=1 Tax=Treponema sp. TaxID=166 RepID=UPI003F017F40
MVCSSDGAIRSLRASGHASFAEKGMDIVCAAESIVLRTSVEMLENTKGLVFNADTSTRGFLEFRVEHVAAFAVERLKCIGDFIRFAFTELSAEYPENVRFQEITE